MFLSKLKFKGMYLITIHCTPSSWTCKTTAQAGISVILLIVRFTAYNTDHTKMTTPTLCTNIMWPCRRSTFHILDITSYSCARASPESSESISKETLASLTEVSPAHHLALYFNKHINCPLPMAFSYHPHELQSLPSFKQYLAVAAATNEPASILSLCRSASRNFTSVILC